MRDVRLPSEEIMAAVEFGYKCCEKGLNIQATQAKALGLFAEQVEICDQCGDDMEKTEHCGKTEYHCRRCEA